MRASYLLTSAVLALSTSVTAGPLEHTDFTFAQWVEDVIANPNGNHLSPSEVVAAIYETRASSPTLKRASCETSGDWGRANAKDAAACVQELATRSGQGIQCEIGFSSWFQDFCRIGNAKITASTGTQSKKSANCNDVARAAGKIFDSCWRADETVMGSEQLDGVFQVNILAP